MKLRPSYKKFKTVISESRDILLALSISAGILFSTYMFWQNQSHEAELNRIKNENEIVQQQANNFVSLALSDIFIGKLDSLIDLKVSKQLDTILELQENTFEQAADFYWLAATRHDTLRAEQHYQQSQHIKLQAQLMRLQRQISQIQGATDYLKDTAYSDSLQNELDRLKFEKQSQRFLRDMEQYHKETINLIKKKVRVRTPTKVSRISKRPFKPKRQL